MRPRHRRPTIYLSLPLSLSLSLKERSKKWRGRSKQGKIAKIEFAHHRSSIVKNLCITAAYRRPVRELIQQERLKDLKKKKNDEEGQSKEDASDAKEESKEERAIILSFLLQQAKRLAKRLFEDAPTKEDCLLFWDFFFL
ncbi:uncharacterized protein LOC131300385 [Rhododendron vialii]|uniref:uncharacterized protein LOC131300385 n=1 Tax=Rhododendron vialii TaxID=182163 RepID=UPI00265E1EE0|nr:uncharacterized protein LOC131300385 [Rhododendron vialii]